MVQLKEYHWEIRIGDVVYRENDEQVIHDLQECYIDVLLFFFKDEELYLHYYDEDGDQRNSSLPLSITMWCNEQSKVKLDV